MTSQELTSTLRDKYWTPTRAGLMSLTESDISSLIVEALKTRQDWTAESLYSIATVSSMLLQDLERVLEQEAKLPDLTRKNG